MSLITLFIFAFNSNKVVWSQTVLSLLGALCEKSWDAEKVRPAYIGERVATPRTPVGPSLT
ncbi:hypothetical protein T10_12557 [Trichinella papuae]|uniref:Uncharacterized protein n=2 Tax=Trichinella papuae TaxID=268474 RepID=A0A0V1LWH6_9BILA|nr:hypothetical protein T10_12557 [Trichinella papuae]